jgi:lipopolysaccharide/colanic/teichoic acid biosynthesis glycosyltransferase
MDIAFLPRKTFKNKMFTYNAVSADLAVAKSKVYSQDGFYYIGKNLITARHLMKAFNGGSSSTSLENAKSELLSLLSRREVMIPQVIICDAGFDVRAIKDFRYFLDKDPSLSLVPFVLDGSVLSEKQLADCRKNKPADEIVFLDDFDETNIIAKTRFLQKVKSKSSEFNRNPVKDEAAGIQNIPKRIFDIILSAILLVILSPVFLLITIAIKVESGDPVFYISKRAGRGYKIFDFYKFRTMFAGADEKIGELSHLNIYNAVPGGGSSIFIKIINDPRITRVGSFLRKTSLDELPQLVNVLLGDMSFVGNRPLPLYEAETLTTNQWAKRFMAPAGITGLWQVKKRGYENMSVEERINLDIDHADKSNFVYDLWIMAMTPSALIQKTNA